MSGFSKAHSPQVIGCAFCHLGDPFSPNKEEAHQGMRLIPGNLSDSPNTCGQTDCHPALVQRIQISLMATGRGMVTVNRYVFDETDSPNGKGHLSALGHSAADSHLRQLCASCHLSQPKEAPQPIDQLSRGGGCTACHLHYSLKAAEELQIYL